MDPIIEVALFAMLGVPLAIDAPVDNPYDPAAIEVHVEIVPPDGEAHDWPAFYDGETWRLRYRPGQLGAHEAIVRVDGASVDTFGFEVVPSALPGPIHADGWGFRRADGSPYVALGLNLGWSDGGGVSDYDAWFEALSAEGGNFARVWVTHFTAQNPTWGTLGQMAPVPAANVDAILDRAEAHGVQVLLVLWQHSQLEALAWSSWESNPYNAANGGPCASSVDFFTEPEALGHQRAFLRYAVARWGAHPGLFGWEVMNEIDGVRGVSGGTVAPWAADHADTLRALDGGLHTVTWSLALPPSEGAESRWTGSDYRQLHHYLGVELDRLVDGVAATLDVAEGPITVGEWGVDWIGHGDIRDIHGLAWHNANWTALSAGSAGNAHTWWWDVHVAPQDLWWRIGGMARAIRGLDLPAMGPVPVQASHGLFARARSDGAQALVWLHDRANTPPEPNERPTAGAVASVPSLGPVSWAALDTRTGEPVAEGVACDGEVPVPTFTGDVALILDARDAPCEAEAACGCSSGGRGGIAGLLFLAAGVLRRARPDLSRRTGRAGR